MRYWFDGDDAQRYGLPAAALLAHIRYWIERNVNNGAKPCMTQSIADMLRYLPFLTHSQIQRNLTKLEKMGAIYRNANGFDRRHTYCLGADVNDAQYETESSKTQKQTIEDLKLNDVHIEINTSKENKRKEVEWERPTEEQVTEYLKEIGAADLAHTLGPEFFNYYEANGWMVGSTPIAKWRPKARQWVSKERNRQSNARQKGFNPKGFTPDGLRDFIDNG